MASWGKMDLLELIRLSARKSVAQMLDRDAFKERMAKGIDIRIHELLYPLLQGWDSVVIEADVEMGGSDQLFNNLVGREFQKEEGREGQVVIVTPLLVGTDGAMKMSKSKGNYIGVTDPPAGPNGMFGKIMSLPDALMESYFTLVTDLPPEEFKPLISAKPRDAKVRLAKEVIGWLHNRASADEAEAEFVRVFQNKLAPEEMPEIAVGTGPHKLPPLIVKAGLAASNSEAIRKIKEGAVSVDGEKVTDHQKEYNMERSRGAEAGAEICEIGGSWLSNGDARWWERGQWANGTCGSSRRCLTRNSWPSATLCRPSARRRSKRTSCRGVPIYSDLGEMLRTQKDIDVVHVCTPSGDHMGPAVAAMEAGKYVITEKPMEIQLDRIDQMGQTAAKNGVKIAGIFQNRWNDANRAIKQAADEGRFGRIAWAGSFTPWYRPDKYYEDVDWRGTWKLDGGGAIMNQSVHAIDLLQWIAGPVQSVSAYASSRIHPKIEVEDTLSCSLQFHNGAFGTIVGTTAMYPGSHVRIEIGGENGTAVSEDGLKTFKFREEPRER